MGWRVLSLVTITLPLYLIAEQLPIRSYTTADGLAADHVDCVVSDSRGFIWFCTPEGLTRFDGYRMVNFDTREGLPDRAIEAFLETRSGAYLVGTSHGLSQFDPGGHSQGFVTYRQGVQLFDKGIHALLETSAGRIWCGMSGGLVAALHTGEIEPAKWADLERTMVTDLKEDVGGKLWVASPSGIYVLGKDGGVKAITQKEGLPNTWVNALLADHAGRLWAATRGGLALMRVEAAPDRCGVQRVYTEKDGLPVTDLHALVEAQDGAIWIGTTLGISVLPSSGDPVFRSLSRAQGLTDGTITALAADAAGNIWAGTTGAGAMRIGSTGFVTFREEDGLSAFRTYPVFADVTGTVLAVTVPADRPGRHLNVFDSASLKFHTVIPKVFGQKSSWGHDRLLLQARTREWWAATKVGLCRFGPMRVADLAKHQPQCYARDVRVYAIFEDSRGGIWASAQSDTGNRLLRWDPARKAISWVENGPSRQELVMIFAEDRSGNIWMAPSRGDLIRYDGRQFTRLTRSNGLPEGVLTALLVDHSGRLWFGSGSHGLGMLANPGSPPFLMRTYDIARGLASNTILCLVEDNMGRIYAGTGKGVDRLDPVTGRIKHFTSADGLPHGRLRSAFRDGSGNLWFGTTQGLSRLTPAADRPPTKPTVLITDLKIFGKTYPVSQAGEAHIQAPELDHSRNQIQVAFVGFNNEPEENLRYTYELAGSSSGWKDPDREHEANYPGLEPGRYTFLVKAVNSEGESSAVAAEVDFVVLPPFWRRLWFECLMFAIAAGLVFAAYRYRLQEIRLRYEERLDERTRIARELHDTLLQSLAGVSLHLDVVAKQIRRSSEAAAAQIQTVRQKVDAAFREARQKVQDLRSPMLQGRALAAVMRESLEEIAARRPVRLRMTVAGQPRPLCAEFEEAVLRIGQEAVANAVRHAQASEIRVLLNYGHTSLTLRIEDDGQGFEVDDPRHGVGHWGLRNMQERAERIGAQWKINTAAGRGTGIEAIVPLNGDK